MNHQCVIVLHPDTTEAAPFYCRCVCGWQSRDVLSTDDAGLLATTHCMKENRK